jgi:hypothetical protein
MARGSGSGRGRAYIKTEIDGKIVNVARYVEGGIVFQSLDELLRYRQLVVLQKIGKIADLVVHPKFNITIGSIKICSVTLDFSYRDITSNGHHATHHQCCECARYEDVKAFYTSEKTGKRLAKVARDYSIRKKLMLAVHGIKINEIDMGEAVAIERRLRKW